MNSTALFELALGMQAPWRIESVDFKELATGQRELRIRLGFTPGHRFLDSEGAACEVHDTVQRQWQHLNFFEHACVLECKVPRITGSDGKVTTVVVPWARPGSGFTLLFEAFAMLLIESEMTVSKVADLLCVYAKRIWRVFNFWIKVAVSKDRCEDIKKVGIDETSAKRGHDYVSVAVDLEKRRVVAVVEGKGKESVEKLAQEIERRGGHVNAISDISIDLSPAFIAGTKEQFPNAKITFDRFHIVKLLNEAMNKLRQQEYAEHQALKGHKYIFLRRPENLSESKRSALDEMTKSYPTLGEGYRLKTLFDDLWQQENEEGARTFLIDWCQQAELAKIGPFINFAKTVRSHMSGIVQYANSRISNGILEGINCKIQLAKRRARGYRNKKNFINMIHFICGKLSFDYPKYSTHQKS